MKAFWTLCFSIAYLAGSAAAENNNARSDEAGDSIIDVGLAIAVACLIGFAGLLLIIFIVELVFILIEKIQRGKNSRDCASTAQPALKQVDDDEIVSDEERPANGKPQIKEIPLDEPLA